MNGRDLKFSDLTPLASADTTAAHGVVTNNGTIDLLTRFDVLMGALARLANAQYVVDPKFRGTGDGSTDDRAAIALADVAAGGTKPVVFSGVHRVASNLTIASPPVFLPGAQLSVDTGVTVNLSRFPDIPPRSQAFTGLGTVLLPNYESQSDPFQPEYWGAGPSKTSAVNKAAIDACFLGSFGVTAPGGKRVQFGKGPYLIPSGGLSYGNINSCIVEGMTSGSPGSGTDLKLESGAGPILTLGNGTDEPFQFTLRDIALDANGIAVSAALYFNNINIVTIDNVCVSGFITGTGVSHNKAKVFQEMYFRRLQVYGSLIGGGGGGTCVDIAPTGNVDFTHCNLENAKTGLKIRGQLYSIVSFNDGHFDAITLYAVDADDTQLRMVASLGDAQIKLGSGVHASTITGSPRSLAGSNGGVSDLGLGNKVSIAGGPHTSAAQKNPTIESDGTWWLRTNNVVDDPLFRTGSTGWAATNSTLTASLAGFPGAPGGGSLLVTASSANGYAARTFAAEASSDYLLQIGFLVHTGNNATARVEVYDETATLIYNSGTLSYTAPANGTGYFAKVHRKRIPTSAGTGKKLTVRIYSVVNGQTTICPFLMLSKSGVLMTASLGGTQSGSGTSLQIAQDLAAGNWVSFASGYAHPGPGLCYFQSSGTITQAAVGCQDDGNGGTAGVQWLIETGAQEHGILLPRFPGQGIMKFYAFSGTGTLTVTDLAVLPVYRDGMYPAIPFVDLDTTPSVAQGSYGRDRFLANNSGATAITTFDDGFEGQEVTIEFTNANTTLTNGATLKLAGAANFVSTADDELTVCLRGGVWREVSRSVN